MDGRGHNSETESARADSVRQPSAAFDYERSLARLGGNPDLFGEIVVLFLEDAPQLLTRAREGLDHQDLPELERAAHSLKGLSVNFDATQLAAASARLEQLAREHDFDRAAACFPELEREFTRLQRELMAYRDSAQQ